MALQSGVLSAGPDGGRDTELDRVEILVLRGREPTTLDKSYSEKKVYCVVLRTDGPVAVELAVWQDIVRDPYVSPFAGTQDSDVEGSDVRPFAGCTLRPLKLILKLGFKLH